MNEYLKTYITKMSITEFYQNAVMDKYIYPEAYQRYLVWDDESRSFLIDSILKNYPIPPIFLRKHVNNDGSTHYEVIDGKQRLTTIQSFIEGNLPLPDNFGSDDLGNTLLDGAYFKDLENFEDYWNRFWSYCIPVIYVETSNDKLITNIFDRLNRNGMPLVPQELRHAIFGTSKIYRTIMSLCEQHCWKDIFEKILATKRMQDHEFVSELLFFILEESISANDSKILDELYDKWKENIPADAIEQFNNVNEYISRLALDYKGLKIQKVSHLYAVWVVSFFAYKQGVSYTQLSEKLSSFYHEYIGFGKDIPSDTAFDYYKRSLIYNTKSKPSREKRVNALIKYLKENGVSIDFSF